MHVPHVPGRFPFVWWHRVHLISSSIVFREKKKCDQDGVQCMVTMWVSPNQKVVSPRSPATSHWMRWWFIAFSVARIKITFTFYSFINGHLSSHDGAIANESENSAELSTAGETITTLFFSWIMKSFNKNWIHHFSEIEFTCISNDVNCDTATWQTDHNIFAWIGISSHCLAIAHKWRCPNSYAWTP